ncbi:MAG: tetratricopeptide repeat protein [Maioricimonas sp. JB045]
MAESAENDRTAGRLRKSTIVVAVMVVGGALVLWGVPRGLGAWHLARARDRLDRREPERAIQSLRTAERWMPADAEVAFLRARAARKLGRMDEVARSLDRASRLGADPDRVRREETLAAAQSGQLSGTLSRLPGLLVASGDDADEVCEAFVEGLVMHHRFHDAAVLLNAWERDFPDDPRPHAYRAAIEASGSNWENSRTHWQKALDRAPDDPDSLLALAECSLELNRPDEALEFLEACRKAAPDKGDEHAFQMVRYRSLRRKGDNDAARHVLEEMARVSEVPLEVQIELARMDVESDRIDAALDRLEGVVHEAPWNVEARSLFAVALTQAGRDDEAAAERAAVAKLTGMQSDLQKQLDRIRETPDDVSARLAAARTLAACSDPRDAIPWLLGVIDLDPGQIEAHRLLAQLYRQTGVPQLADQHARIVQRLALEQDASASSAP